MLCQRCWYVATPLEQLGHAILTFHAACVVGSSIICIDLLVRHIPGKSNFRVQDSNAFLSASLSLSFGVMVRRCSFTQEDYGAHTPAAFLLAIWHATFSKEIPDRRWSISAGGSLYSDWRLFGRRCRNTDCISFPPSLYSVARC